MNLRAMTAATLTAGALTTTVGGVAAYADTAPTPTPAPATTGQPDPAKHCVNAADKITRLQTRQTTIEGNLDRLHKALDTAKDGKHPKAASRIQTALDRRQKAHDRIADRVAKLKSDCRIS
jgi:uncharacterized protein YqgV (UPF0045/DUF77 family)